MSRSYIEVSIDNNGSNGRHPVEALSSSMGVKSVWNESKPVVRHVEEVYKCRENVATDMCRDRIDENYDHVCDTVKSIF